MLFDYFAAPDDATALDAFEEGPEAVGLATLPTKGVEPAVLLGRAEALLRDLPYETVAAQPRQAGLLSDPEDGAVFLLTVTDELRDAIRTAGRERLADVAAEWARAEEFHVGADADELASWLGRLGELADPGLRLYCRIVV
ncbi:hypothetical protein [Streptomyces fradiae]|uniref:hypothetical protein n=1 Tax=Streptomyces fradiae TaxID=1906 RepID=UPI0035153DF3